jgi:HEAT repeat protein
VHLRGRAASALGRIKGPEALAAVTQVVTEHLEEGSEPPSLVLQGAVEACGLARWEGGVPLLIRLIMEPGADHAVQLEAGKALGLIGTADALEAMKRIPGEPEYRFVLAWAVEALGKEAAQREVPWLSDLATANDDPDVRGAAALALARAGTPDARSRLKVALDRDMQSLDYRTVEAAGEAADPSYVPRLSQIASRHPAWNLRAVAAIGLGRIATPEARTALRGVIENETDSAVLRDAVKACAATADASFVPGLAAVIGKGEDDGISWDVRREAVRALGGIRAAEARAALERALEHERRRGPLKRDRNVMAEIKAALLR